MISAKNDWELSPPNEQASASNPFQGDGHCNGKAVKVVKLANLNEFDNEFKQILTLKLSPVCTATGKIPSSTSKNL